MNSEPFLIIFAWLFAFGFVVLETRNHDGRIFGAWLQQKGEPAMVAVREWFKAIGFIVASIAAIFAFKQFDLADKRLQTDQRPWISSSPAIANDIELGPNGLSWTTSMFLKNVGMTPGLHVAVGQEAIVSGTPFVPNELRAKACAQAEQSMAAIAVFPRDEVRWEMGGNNISSKAIDAFNETPFKLPSAELSGFVVQCLAYRSPLDDSFHHTVSAMALEIDGLLATDADGKSTRKLNGRFRGVLFDRVTFVD